MKFDGKNVLNMDGFFEIFTQENIIKQKDSSSNITDADAKLSEIQEQQIVSDDDFILSILYPTSKEVR